MYEIIKWMHIISILILYVAAMILLITVIVSLLNSDWFLYLYVKIFWTCVLSAVGMIVTCIIYFHIEEIWDF